MVEVVAMCWVELGRVSFRGRVVEGRFRGVWTRNCHNVAVASKWLHSGLGTGLEDLWGIEKEVFRL